MNLLLWILQVVVGLYFLGTGIVHFGLPPGALAPMAWVYELPPVLHWISGPAEVLAGFGLILPGLTRIRPDLAVLAAAGLVLVMAGAALGHVQRGEFANILMNVVLGALAGFIVYGRRTLAPLPGRTPSS